LADRKTIWLVKKSAPFTPKGSLLESLYEKKSGSNQLAKVHLHIDYLANPTALMSCHTLSLDHKYGNAMDTIPSLTRGVVQDKNAGASVGMQSKITGGREACGNIGSLV